ncbi:winged helix-turn-helix domain-containing protein [Luteipulveratus flavus]|uniref:Crosslink repair DNA glycosylase YcaQ family protein n=1 Tax=Luteipulveratus flavus TaxID=3031728 RepID=A0ABT6C2X8_9MICO|nr:crosslink repair DNA glycosylase YcaQ family protein [Luteipulveratus sp. YIM 133296]MDF8262903.1 crosslink repair DNA glycosylase YcaQ family protein [Luteipulveratus sp. YIM 133296]
MSSTSPVLSKAAARRVALAAQGFRDIKPAPWAATSRHVQRVIDRVGVVQIDSVNVLTRSHYLPFFARLGPYDPALLDRARDRAPRRLVEYWAHEASLVPPSTWPLLDFRMRRAQEESWGGMQRVARDHPELVAAVLAEVTAHGPLTSRQCEQRLEHDVPRSSEHWGWNWSLVKNALEHLFWAGALSSAGRTSQFERRYDVPARVLPPAVRPSALDPAVRPDPAAAAVELVRIAARAHGVGTEQCLRDYFRLRPDHARPAIDHLVATGELEPVRIAGWNRPAYLHQGASRPRRLHAEALLSPFDSLIWQRDRTLALFDFHYRLEVYVPAAQRVHGYYVLPFLFGDRLVARVDLKADRGAGALRVQQRHWEADAPTEAYPALDRQLRLMADWLGLTDVLG